LAIPPDQVQGDKVGGAEGDNFSGANARRVVISRQPEPPPTESKLDILHQADIPYLREGAKVEAVVAYTYDLMAD